MNVFVHTDTDHDCNFGDSPFHRFGAWSLFGYNHRRTPTVNGQNRWLKFTDADCDDSVGDLALGAHYRSMNNAARLLIMLVTGAITALFCIMVVS